MLSSQIVPSSRSSMFHILKFPMHSSCSILRSTGTLPRTRTYQIRTLRLGIWPACREPGSRKDDKSRHFTIKDGYYLSRGSGWGDVFRRRSAEEQVLDEFCRARTHVFGNFADSKNERAASLRGNINIKVRSNPNDEEYSHEAYDKESFEPQVQNGQEEYVIDPITNRKVPKQRKSKNTRRKPEKPGRRFQHLMPEAQDSTPMESQPTPLVPNGVATPSDYSDSFFDNKSGAKYPCDQEGLQDYDAVAAYGPIRDAAINHGIPRSDPVQEALRTYDERVSYAPVYRNNPAEEKEADRSSKVPVGSSDYDGATNYEPGAFNGNVTAEISHTTPEDGLKEYDDSFSYEPGSFNGQMPGNQTSETENSLNEYDDIISYEPGKFNGGLLKEESTAIDNGLKEYDDTTSYEPGSFNGKLPGEHVSTTEDGLADYDSVTSYEPGDFNGKLPDEPSTYTDEGLKEYDSSTSYEPGKFNGTVSRDHPILNDEGLQDYDDVISYEPGVFNGKLPKGQLSIDQDGLKEYDESTSYEPGAFNAGEPVFGLKKDINSPSFESKLARRKQLEEEFLAKEEIEPIDAAAIRGRLAAKYSQSQPVPQDPLQEVERDYINGRGSQSTFSRCPETPRIQTAMDRRISHEVPEDSSDLYSKTPQGLETNYSEERKFQHEADPYSRTPQGLETSFRDEAVTKTRGNELSSKNRTRQDKSEHTRLTREIRNIYEDAYGEITSKHRQTSESPIQKQPKEIDLFADTQEPTLYKILAYDPTMQSISTAETTSIVPDSADALTPAEVLLRLSNPVKFFPHFEPLQSQGYEIISGAGDILVFRKVRGAKFPGAKIDASMHHDHARTNTNPIDGMQPTAATGNFASPTGFVNYDRPESDPPFISNIDVRREEPVFSGRSSWMNNKEGSQGKKPSMGKRVLVGGAMVGGASYAIGVVADYFQTGGKDRKGPREF